MSEDYYYEINIYVYYEMEVQISWHFRTRLGVKGRHFVPYDSVPRDRNYNFIY